MWTFSMSAAWLTYLQTIHHLFLILPSLGSWRLSWNHIVTLRLLIGILGLGDRGGRYSSAWGMKTTKKWNSYDKEWWGYGCVTNFNITNSAKSTSRGLLPDGTIHASFGHSFKAWPPTRPEATITNVSLIPEIYSRAAETERSTVSASCMSLDAAAWCQ